MHSFWVSITFISLLTEPWKIVEREWSTTAPPGLTQSTLVDGCLLDSAELMVDESVLEGRQKESLPPFTKLPPPPLSRAGLRVSLMAERTVNHRQAGNR